MVPARARPNKRSYPRATARKIAARIKLDHPEFAADDPSRATECDEDGGSMKNGEVSNLDTLRPAD